MISTLVIVFRESLEAAMIVSIVLAASRGIAGRTAYVAGGFTAGIVGALVVAFFADAISGLVDGVGSELFNATVLILAVFMLGWHQIWMSSHGAELAKATRELGQQVRVGVKPLSALAGITAVAVLREGSETVLFLYGILVQGASNPSSMALGGFLGFLAAAVLGWLLYTGLVRFSIGYVFGLTGVIITLLAAGLAAQAASFLVQSGWLPPLGYSVWDTSWLLSEQSPLGLLMHILVGYISQPLGIQVVAYLVTLVAIVGASTWARRAHAHRKTAV